jgi:hypothetical protein
MHCALNKQHGRTPGIQWIGGWVDPRACLDDVENINTGYQKNTGENLY